MANPGNDYSGSEVLTPPTHGGPSQALVTAPPPGAIGHDVHGGPGMGGPEILHGSFNQTWLFHCLRRRWLMAVLLGLLCSGATAGLLWWAFPESARTTAYLEVKAQPEEDILSGRSDRKSSKEIEMYAANQAALIKSNKVLEHALTPASIAQLDAVIQQSDPIQWLIDELRVSYPNDGEILEIRYDGQENPEDMKKIIDQIVTSYLEVIIGDDINEQNKIFEGLRTMHREIKDNLSEMMDDYTRQQEDFGGEGSPQAEAETALLSAALRGIDNRMAAAQKELSTIEVGMRVAAMQAKSPTLIQNAVAQALESDPTIANFRQEIFTLDQQIRQLASSTKNPNTPQIKQLRNMKSQATQQMEMYRRDAETSIKQELANRPNDELQAIYLQYSLQKQMLENELSMLDEERAEKEEELIAKSSRNPKLETLMMEIEQESEIEKTLNLKTRSHQLTQDQIKDRVTRMQRAYTSPNINFIERVAIAALGGLGALAATCYFVALVDFRKRRLNKPADVDEGLGIRVLGVLPAVTCRKALAAKSMVAAQAAEGIDNVRATLMHDSTTRRRQVVLVTGSASLEGCSTVATQLAVSLAKAGRRTLLIDGDLRSPSLHNLFGLPLEDGFSEVLRSEIDLADAIRPTQHESLYALTAGVSDMDAIHALATDLPQPIFEKLRSQFDFVVIDGPPVLGLADSLSLGQYADGAVLSVLRDHSELAKVNKAADLMQRMGVPLIGAVIGGVPMKADRRVTRLLKAQSAKQRRLPAAAAGAAADAKPHAGNASTSETVHVDDDVNLDDLDDIDIDNM